MNKCIVCERELVGGLDTFGPIGLEMCWDCWKVAGDEPEWAWVDAVYGLAPHFHTYDWQGNLIIGGTRFLELPACDDSGLIAVREQFFMPDPDCLGLGTWFRSRESALRFTLLKEGLE